jgi:hypothetical protein
MFAGKLLRRPVSRQPQDVDTSARNHHVSTTNERRNVAVLLMARPYCPAGSFGSEGRANRNAGSREILLRECRFLASSSLGHIPLTVDSSVLVKVIDFLVASSFPELVTLFRDVTVVLD